MSHSNSGDRGPVWNPILILLLPRHLHLVEQIAPTTKRKKQEGRNRETNRKKIPPQIETIYLSSSSSSQYYFEMSNNSFVSSFAAGYKLNNLRNQHSTISEILSEVHQGGFIVGQQQQQLVPREKAQKTERRRRIEDSRPVVP